ncbi:MAG: glycosyltransferase family 2 protein [Bacteroidota bacterium]|jgi:glycosyltransferase involved in cell wall biosynthesis
MKPLVSIILPTYNGERYLASAINSCLAQTMTDWELIIVDDCSTDRTPEIIHSFQQKDQRIRCIRNEKNLKLPSSLNVGSVASNGRYLTWTSDDNLYSPDALLMMIRKLEQDNSVGLVYADYTLINDAGNVIGEKRFGDINQSRVSWKGCGACFLYRSELHHQVGGYDPSAFLIEDYDFFLRASLITRFAYLPTTDLYLYRHHAESLTSLYGFYNIDLQKIVIERQLSRLLRTEPRSDHARWLRKFAIYYGVQKGNVKRMNHYLELLFNESIVQGLLTSMYIPMKRLLISVSVWLALPRGVVGGIFNRNDQVE